MARPLRLVKVLPFLSERFGGSVVQARLLCRELARRGHRVRIVTGDLGQDAAVPRARWLEQDGCEVWHAATLPWHRVPPYWPPAIAAPLRQVLADADLLCNNVGLTLMGARACRLARSVGVPYVCNAEGAYCPERLAIKRLRKRVFLRLVERPMLARAAAVQALTAKDADDIVALGVPRARVHVVPNGVPPAAGMSAIERAAMRRRLGLPQEATVLLFLGRLHVIKGLDLALRAAAPLLRDRPGVALVLAGPDDGAGAELRRLSRDLGVAGRVTFPGSFAGDDKRALLATADLFAHTSRTEGLPMAVLEAAAAGLPLWLTDACQVPEVAEFGAGTVDPVDPVALQRSLQRLLDDVALRQRCAENARRMVAERFSLSRVADRLEELYRSLVR